MADGRRAASRKASRDTPRSAPRTSTSRSRSGCRPSTPTPAAGAPGPVPGAGLGHQFAHAEGSVGGRNVGRDLGGQHGPVVTGVVLAGRQSRPGGARAPGEASGGCCSCGGAFRAAARMPAAWRDQCVRGQPYVPPRRTSVLALAGCGLPATRCTAPDTRRSGPRSSSGCSRRAAPGRRRPAALGDLGRRMRRPASPSGAGPGPRGGRPGRRAPLDEFGALRADTWRLTVDLSRA